jgi:DNA-binding CsgD family transcriptional regulator
MLWSLLVPLLAVLSGVPALTIAWLAGHQTRDPARRLFAGGLSLLTAIIVLVMAGVFVDLRPLADSLTSGPGLKFVFWNLTFLVAFASLIVFRRFSTVVLGQPRPLGVVFWTFSVIFYAGALLLGFVSDPPVLDFQGNTPSGLATAYYLVGISSPAWRVWRGRKSLPRWLEPLVGKLAWILLPLGLLTLLWETLRGLGLLTGWPSLTPLVFLSFFALVTYELVRRFPSPGMATDARTQAERLLEKFPSQKITPREQEILILLLEGRKNQQIASVLGVSGHTVKNHVYNLYQKLGTDNRLELQALATDFWQTPK